MEVKGWVFAHPRPHQGRAYCLSPSSQTFHFGWKVPVTVAN